ncbi:ABC transporter permease [Dactylosporangium fulvum]|uniref:Transport permease protein n=1 Tax=Dactylosporangium fulvum TaxID=53359 RepID=A0ABY5VPH1_9ACTN|nr:ABC transporter permease [Dactylosporangium fulvum]UWP79070.1 ABC transporter permease [Dactylosporangium fulvum]
MKPVTDAGTVFAREMMPTFRNPIGILFMMAEPAVFLLLFGPLLSGMPGTGGGTPWEWFVPGILVMLALFGTTGAGYSLLVELTGGSLERMLVTPLNRTAMLIGRTLKEIVTLLLQAVLIVLVVLPFGLRPHPVGLAAALVLLATFGTGLGGLAFALAIAARRQQELFYGVQQVVLFPVVLIAGVLLPTEAAPGWLRALSRVNPVTYVVDAERALFRGDVWSAEVVYGLAAAAGIAAAGLALGTRAMRRATL